MKRKNGNGTAALQYDSGKVRKGQQKLNYSLGVIPTKKEVR